MSAGYGVSGAGVERGLFCPLAGEAGDHNQIRDWIHVVTAAWTGFSARFADHPESGVGGGGCGGQC